MKNAQGGEFGAAAREMTAAADFWAVWMRHRDYLYRRCVRWLGGDQHDAEDVLSKGAVNAAIYVRDNPRGVLQFRPWILRVLHNLCIDHMRARSRVAPPPATWAPTPTPTPTSPARGPDQELLRGEIGRSITHAADGLPAHLQQVFLLRFVDELPYEQIAEAQGITPENARKRLQQVRSRMRDALRSLA
jgi:RNA polymerase sigma factor (sigma-70 family)